MRRSAADHIPDTAAHGIRLIPGRLQPGDQLRDRRRQKNAMKITSLLFENENCIYRLIRYIPAVFPLFSSPFSHRTFLRMCFLPTRSRSLHSIPFFFCLLLDIVKQAFSDMLSSRKTIYAEIINKQGLKLYHVV